VGHCTEQWITVPHYRPVFKPPLRIHFAVVHNHDHMETRRRALIQELDVKKPGSSAARRDSLRGRMLWQGENRRRSIDKDLLTKLNLPAELYSFNHLRFVVAVL
jgi:hypothetical protein